MTALMPLPMAPITTDEAHRHAKRLAASSLVPESLRGKPDDILLVVMLGHRLGLGPDQSVQWIHVVKGKPVLSADLIVAQCLRHADRCEYFIPTEITPTTVTCETKRVGAPRPVTYTYTMDDAKRAGLSGKGNWSQHPADMLRARCSAKLARAVYPDLVIGLYAPEEMDADRDAGPPPRSLLEVAEAARIVTPADVEHALAAGQEDVPA